MYASAGLNPVLAIIYLRRKKKRKNETPTPYFISGGNVYANLRGINVRENALTLLYAFPPWIYKSVAH